MLSSVKRQGPIPLWLFTLVAITWACGGATPPVVREDSPRRLLRTRGARDVLLVTIDTLRHDAVGYSGSGKVATPNIDRLAADGVVFETAHAHAVVTLASHASILTGLYPYQHGIRDNARFTLRDGLPTLALVLRNVGYGTAAFVSAFPLDRRFGLARGFEVYDDQYGGTRSSDIRIAERPGEETVARALAWWNANAARPRFMWVHLFTPHFPYEPKEPFATRYRDAPYYGEVAQADAQLEPLLAALRERGAKPALLVLTADHGESLGEHGEQTHGLFAYEATLRVPLVMWAPGMLDRGRVRAHARHVDLVPTICDLLSLKAPPGLAGRSLFSDTREDGSYFEAMSAHLNRGWAPLLGRIDSGMKAISLPLPELYDLEVDPTEAHNLVEKDRERHRAILAALPPSVTVAVEPGRLDEEEIARLRSLGYLAGGNAPPPSAREDDPSLDPKNLIESEYIIDRALTSWRKLDTDGAIRLLTDLVARQPRMAVAYSHLASMYTDLGRLDEAVTTLSRAAAAGVADEEMRVKLALALSRNGHADHAWNVLSGDGESTDPETQSALGRIAAELGRMDEARRRFERALELDSTYPEGLVDLGTFLLNAGDLAGARSRLEQGLAQNPDIAEGWNALGVVRLKSGEESGARQAWEKAVEADPRYPDALFNLALAYEHSGEYDRQASALEKYIGLVEGEDRERATRMLRQIRGVAGRRG